MKYIKFFEEFEEPKPEPMMQRLARGTRKFLNIDKKEDRETIEKIYRTIDSQPITSGDFKVDFVKSVVEIEPGVYIIYLINGNVTLDDNNRTISYNGKELQLKNIDVECEKLRDMLRRPQFRKFLPMKKYDIIKNPNRTRDNDPYEGLPPYGQEDF